MVMPTGVHSMDYRQSRGSAFEQPLPDVGLAARVK